MINGLNIGAGVAQSADSVDVPYTIVIPARCRQSLEILRREVARWDATATQIQRWASEGKITQDVAKRARFTVDTLKGTVSNLVAGVCCGVVAIDDQDHIGGVLNYLLIPPTSGIITTVAVDPHNVPGSPFTSQFRGVGTALVAASSRRLLASGVTKLLLHPKDREARRFWMRRGFTPCPGKPDAWNVCMEGKKEIEALIDGCIVGPESAFGGEVVLCGMPEAVRARVLQTIGEKNR